MTERLPGLAVLGGTGALGAGLAMRCALAGYPVVVGSRNQAKAAAAAADFNARAGIEQIRGLANPDAAAAADVAILTVPFAHHQGMLEAVRDAIQGKIFVDATVPLVPPKVRTVQLPPGGSVAKASQAYLGNQVRVVSAFQNVAADRLADLGREIDCDVLVCGNDPAARETVVQLAAAAGLRAWHAGRIDNSVVAESLTSALIFINRHYKIEGSGLRITGAVGTETGG